MDSISHHTEDSSSEESVCTTSCRAERRSSEESMASTSRRRERCSSEYIIMSSTDEQMERSSSTEPVKASTSRQLERSSWTEPVADSTFRQAERSASEEPETIASRWVERRNSEGPVASTSWQSERISSKQPVASTSHRAERSYSEESMATFRRAEPGSSEEPMAIMAMASTSRRPERSYSEEPNGTSEHLEAARLAEYQARYRKRRLQNRQQAEKQAQVEEEMKLLHIPEHGIMLGKPPLLALDKMGLKPGPADIVKGFAHPSFGPARADFTEEDGFQDFYVSSVTGPEKFSIKNIPQKQALKTLEAAMTEYYDYYWTYHSKMKRGELLLGGFYAFYCNKFQIWGRCRFEDFVMEEDASGDPENPSLAIQLLDYGTWEIITLGEIYPLRPQFLELPCQACIASLYDNNDPPVEWTRDDNKEFINAVGGKVIRAFVAFSDVLKGEVLTRVQLIVVDKDKGTGAANGLYLYADRLNIGPV